MGLLAPYHHSYIQFTPVTDRVFKLCLRNFYHEGVSLLFQLKFTDCKEIKVIHNLYKLYHKILFNSILLNSLSKKIYKLLHLNLNLRKFFYCQFFKFLEKMNNNIFSRGIEHYGTRNVRRAQLSE